MDWEAIRRRYLEDPPSKRLGALAANLARISSFSAGTPNLKIVKSLLEESEYFIEWGILDVPVDLREKLVELQVKLAIWRYRLNRRYNAYEVLAREFKKLSEELLRASGITE